MLAIIFGSNGQDGQYLQQLLLEKQFKVIGYSRTSVNSANVASYPEVEVIIKNYKPDFVFHLAANSTTNHHALFENHETISTGTINILESVYRYSPHTKVFITGSGVQFKNTGKPISENTEFEGNSPYSVARIQSVFAARYYRSKGIKTYVGYLFHHESPFRKPNHISKLITTSIKQILAGNQKIIELGDITINKEWTFARDITEAIFTLVNQDAIFEAVIGSGEPFSIQDWLEACFQYVDLDWHNYVKLKPNFTPEYKLLVSNPKLIKSLGWEPKTSFNQLAQIMIQYDG